VRAGGGRNSVAVEAKMGLGESKNVLLVFLNADEFDRGNFALKAVEEKLTDLWQGLERMADDGVFSDLG